MRVGDIVARNPKQEGGAKPPDIVERTFVFGQRVTNLCRYIKRKKLDVPDISRQLMRAGNAVGAMVEESQGAESRKDFIHKLSIALKEARESFYWLRRLKTSKVLAAGAIDGLTDEGKQIKLVLAAIINSARRNMDAGAVDVKDANDGAGPEDE